MAKKTRRILALVLTLVLAFSLLPIGGVAEGGSDQATTAQTVYVYVKNTQYVSGTLNDHGYYTIGKITINLPAPSSKYVGENNQRYTDNAEQITAALNNIVRYSRNTGINLASVKWYTLHCSDGADNYVNSGSYAWHLDGEVAVYNVTYNANGGVGADYASGFTQSSQVNAESNATIGFTKAGYTFTGWNTSADGSGTSYAAGATITSAIDQNYVLYAQWEETPSTSAAATTTVTVNKTWTTTGDASAPTSLAVTLQKNGAYYRTATLTSATGWTYTWSDLPNDGSTYTVAETVPANYTQGTTVTEAKPLVINNCKIVNPCDKLSFSNWDGAFVVMKKGNDTYVWTYSELSAANKTAFVTAFNNISGTNSLGLDDKATFVYGVSASVAGMTIDNASKSITYSAKRDWSKFAYGTYDDAGKTITLANTYVPPTGTLTITKTVTGFETLPANYSVTIKYGTDSTVATGTDVTFTAASFTKNASGAFVASTNVTVNPGTYYAKETASVGGTAFISETADTAVKSATVAGGGTGTLAFTNAYAPIDATVVPGSITITKAIGTGNQYDGAAMKEYTFTVTGPSYPDGTTVTITGAGSQTLNDLAAGTYTITENDASVASYDLTTTCSAANNTVALSLGDADNNNTRTVSSGSVTFTNTYAKHIGENVYNHVTLTVNKTDGTNLITSSSATFTLTNTADSTKVYTATTTDGVASFTFGNDAEGLIPAGTYTLAESSAPAGYTKSDATWTVKVTSSYELKISDNGSFWHNVWNWIIGDADGASISGNTISVSNTKKTGTATAYNDATVTKTDGTNQITGATFGLYNNEGCTGTAIKTYNGGQFTISAGDTALANYLPTADSTTLYLKETAAPAGYTASTTVYPVVITKSIGAESYVEASDSFVTTTTYSVTAGGNGTLSVANSRIDYTLTVNYYIEGTTTVLNDMNGRAIHYGDTYNITSDKDVNWAYPQLSGTDGSLYNIDAEVSDPVTGKSAGNVVINLYYTLAGQGNVIVNYFVDDANYSAENHTGTGVGQASKSYSGNIGAAFDATADNLATIGGKYTFSKFGTGNVNSFSGSFTSGTTYIDLLYTRDTGTLILSKVFGQNNQYAENQTFSFTVAGPDGYSNTVEVTVGRDVTLTVPTGTYTVTENGAAVNGYTLSTTYAASYGADDAQAMAALEANQIVIGNSGRGTMTVTNTYTPVEVNIPDPPVPTIPTPEPSDIPDPEVPATDIPDPETPKADAGQQVTGDELVLWITLALASAAALVYIIIIDVKRRNGTDR